MGMASVFGERVRAHRRRLGLSQEDLAGRANVDAKTIRNLEAGRRTPRPSTVRLLADALELHGPEREEFYAAAAAPRAAIAGQGPRLVPRQLPAPPQLFTGRVGELATLDQAHRGSATAIVVIDGMAGVGKTAVAVQAAYRMSDRYPEGQLFIDLHGYTEGVAPVTPDEALDRMLRALGIPGPQIPTSLDERAALYRTRLAGQRMLILLDNAATEAQVVPLLPGAPGCLVIVTSRRRLVSLDRTHALSLDTLPTPDAIRLFRRIVGEGRPIDQPSELVELVELCGRLPLALRIAAARLRSHSAWKLSYLMARLRDQQQRLGELAAGQRSVTAALDLSYHHLSPDQQRAYRLLGLHPGLDIDSYATAALLDSTLPHATRLLDQLLDAHLLLEPAADRYRFHDLTRAHAAGIAAGSLPEPTRSAAVDRLLDHYRHTASAAADTAYPYERGRRPRVPPATTPTPDVADPAAALRWLDTELPNLLAAATCATEDGKAAHVLHLSTILHRHLCSRSLYHEAETLHHQTLVTARVISDSGGQLDALVSIGWLYLVQGRYAEAADHYQQALRIARATGSRAGEVDSLVGLGDIHRLQGRYAMAADHYRQALHIARAAGERTGELRALTGLGGVHRLQGRYAMAADHYQRALRVARSIGYRLGELNALIGLGRVHWIQGRYAHATAHLRHALQLARTIGNRTGELNSLAGLGDVYRLQRCYEQAADHFRQALQIARVTGDRTGELNTLTGLGAVLRRQEQHAQASERYQELLRLARASGERNFEFEAWQGLGRLAHSTGSPARAVAYHDRALALATDLGQPIDQVRAHDGLAKAHHALDQHELARGYWQRALGILTGIGVDHTEEEETTVPDIRAGLAGLDQRRSTRSAAEA